MSTDQSVIEVRVTREKPAAVSGLAPGATVPVDKPNPAAPDMSASSKLTAWFGRFGSLALVFSVGTAFAMYFFNALQGIMLARLLGPTARGEYSTIVFYTQALTFVCLMGTQLAIARRAGRSPGSLPELAKAAIGLGTLTGLGAMVAVTLLALLALPADKSYLAPLCIASALFLPWEHIRLCLLAIDHGTGRFTRYNLQRLLAAAMLPLLMFTAWIVADESLRMFVALSVLAPLAPLAIALYLNRAALASRAQPKPVVLVKEGLPFAVAQIASDFLTRVDVLLMLWLATFAVQGYYAAAVPAAGMLVMAPFTVALFAFNAGVKQKEAFSVTGLWARIGAIFGFQCLTALAYAAILPWLLVFVYGQEFAGAVPFTLALLPGYAINGCAIVAEGYLQGRGKSMVGVWVRLNSAVVMLVLAWALWGTWQEMSIPIAASIAQIVNAAWILWFVVREAVLSPAAAPQQSTGRN